MTGETNTPEIHREKKRSTAVGDSAPLMTGLGLLSGFGALLASSCCALPLAFATAGLSGAWLGNIGVLASYKAYFFTIALIVIAAAWMLALRRRAGTGKEQAQDLQSCSSCSGGLSSHLLLIFATALVLVAITTPWIEPYLLRYLLSL